ncbi:MAG TPA: HAMP domain-containing sensor histidine kinase [Acidimicrobiales bacterium]|nr:HAMP domain-containing sensor histidine kinase [Acidimicrobiales bacterium]
MADAERAAEALAIASARAENAEERLRSQTMLLAEAEHRLKTALAVITGWASTLVDRWADLDEAVMLEGLDIIRRTSEGMAEQARQLLSEARAEIRLLDLAPVELDLVEVLSLNAAAYDGMSPGHRIDHVTADAAVRVEVDPAALQQVLGHLLENAVQYTPADSRVTVGARRDGTDVVIEVTDEGPGVDPSLDVFAPFVRGDTGTDGTGLGLYIVRNLVRAMGGDVAVGPNPAGRGSVFSVRLPG